MGRFLVRNHNLLGVTHVVFLGIVLVMVLVVMGMLVVRQAFQ